MQLDGHITRRQREIIKMIAQNLTEKEISDRLGISPATLELHTNLIKQRLGVTDTAAIVTYAIRNEISEH